MQTVRAKNAGKRALVSTLFGVLAVTGCQSDQAGTGGGKGASKEIPVTQMMSGPGGGLGAVNQLDYFEALERRSNVTWDELLTGVLLAAGRRADGAYADRLSVARRAGILGTETQPSGESIATPGDLAKLLLRAQGVRLRNTISDEEAIALAARRSLMPAEIGVRDPLTGAVTVHAISAAGHPTGSQKTNSATTKPPTGGSNP